jgi:hypothetical protein
MLASIRVVTFRFVGVIIGVSRYLLSEGHRLIQIIFINIAMNCENTT